jgi:hypothetical protein
VDILTGDQQAGRDGIEFLGVAHALDGRVSEAAELATRLAAVASRESTTAYPGLLSVLTGIDVTAALHRVSPWQEVNRLLAQGRLEDALANLDAMSARTDAAIVRLVLAQRQGPEPWASEAQAFFVEVGATRFLQEVAALSAGRRSA